MNENTILKFKNKFSEKFLKLEKLISKTLPSQIIILDQILNHIEKFNGKRIRTILLFLFYEYFVDNTENEEEILNIALAIEFIHNATLFHDDVIDNNKELRRGAKPANQIWHNKLCILSGDFLLAKAFEKIIETNKKEISEILSKTSTKIIKGEVNQLIFNEYRESDEYKFDDYLSVILEKTAILFSSAAKIGAILGISSCKKNIYQKKNQKEIEKLLDDSENFGKYLGIIFQIMDDILDYFGDQNILGKKIGTDFFEKKITLPAILLKEKFFDQSRYEDETFKQSCQNEWSKIWPSKEIDYSENELKQMFEKFLNELKKYKIFEESFIYINKYLEKAKNAMKNLEQQNSCKNEKSENFFKDLSEILNFLTQRKI